MHKHYLPPSFVRSTLAILVTVVICAVTLALMRRLSSDAELSSHGSGTLSASIHEAPALILAAKTETVAKKRARKNRDDDDDDDEEEVAAKTKSEPVPLPMRAQPRKANENDDDGDRAAESDSEPVPLPARAQARKAADDENDDDAVPLPVRKNPAKPEGKTDVKANATAEAATDGKTEVKADVKAEAKTDAAAESKTAASEAKPETAQKSPPEPAPAAMPAPKGRLAKADADQALAPLLNFTPPGSELDTLKEFVKLTYKEEYSKARGVMTKFTDPVMLKFARWYYYRAKAPDTTAQEILAFIDENPTWPEQDVLKQAAEDALFWREEDPQKVIAYFNGKRPISGTGKAALGSALIAVKRTAEGEALIREAWRKTPLTPAIEKKLRKLHVLNAEDHRLRADYLLLQDRSYIGAAKRLLPMIDSKWRAAVKAQIASAERSKSAGTQLNKLGNDIKNDPAVIYARVQHLRRTNKDTMVWSLLRSAPKSEAKLIDPMAWWTVRDSQVRLALNAGHPKTAYALAAEHGEGLEHSELSDAEFLAGWIALRFLGQPEDARKHFLASAAAGGLPKRRARASYWLGRTELELKNERMATARFAEAAQHDHTFYGQLAHQMIAATDAKVALRNFVNPTDQEIKSFLAKDVMKAIVIAQKAEFDNLLAVFLFDLARRVDSAPEMVLACELAIRAAPRHLAVRMAKVAMNRDFPVEHYAYPDALPEFKNLTEGQAIDAALVHALTRQESEFNPATVSSAGAVGLMQLLPSTAKMVAGWHDLKFEKNKLAADPAYNVSLGTAFLHKLISNYDGSYIMALAGYNAGPGRIRQWTQQFGDPREKNVDPIDWIERIPFNETHDYVHKILESAQIYRSRLQGDKAPLRLAEDLYRGRKDQPQFMNNKPQFMNAGAASN